MMIEKISFTVLSYLAGSIPFGLLYSLIIMGEDIRESGSGNIGATNVLRNFGWISGLTVLLFDAAKGAIPSYIAWVYFPSDPGIWIIVGSFAIIGHIFPVFLKFSGGKGVATSAGVFLILTPFETALALMVFFIGVGISRYMSLGSLMGALTLPSACSYFQGIIHPVTVGAWLLAIVVLWRHRNNMKRLIRGEENTFF